MAKLKGKAGLRPTYEPLGVLESKQHGGSVGKRGRDAEWQRLRSSIAELLTYQLGGSVVVMGMRGSGKKLLVQALEQHGKAAHMLVALGRGGKGGRAKAERELLEAHPLPSPWFHSTRTRRLILMLSGGKGGQPLLPSACTCVGTYTWSTFYSEFHLVAP